MIQGFSHLGVVVADLDRSRRFYCDTFGFAPLYELDFDHDEVAATMEQSGPFRSAMLLRGDVRVELLQWKEREPAAPGRRPMTDLGISHLSFRVERLEDHFGPAAAAGGTVLEHTLTELPGEPPTRLVYLTDPDGTRIELMENVPDLSALGAQA